MAKVISFSLDKDSISKAISEIRAYQNTLQGKCETLCKKLAAEGIVVAETHIGTSTFGKYVHLGVSVSSKEIGCSAIVFMRDTQKIKSEWQTQDGTKSAEISPILMLEFGAGLHASNPKAIPGVGTGTFPGGTHGNEPGWYYMDLDGNWHHSTGYSAKMPMYYASIGLREKIVTIAKEVFR